MENYLMARTYESMNKTETLFPIVAKTGLDITILGGNVNKQAEVLTIASRTLTLTPNADNYVCVCWDHDRLEVATTGFPLCGVPLWKLTTDATKVIATVDARSVLREAAHSSPSTSGSYVLDTTFNSDSGWLDLDLSSLAPVGASGVLLVTEVAESGTPGGGVYFAVRKLGDTDVSRQFPARPQVSGLPVTAYFPVGMSSGVVQYRAVPDTLLTVTVALAGWMYGV